MELGPEPLSLTPEPPIPCSLQSASVIHAVPAGTSLTPRIHNTWSTMALTLKTLIASHHTLLEMAHAKFIAEGRRITQDPGSLPLSSPPSAGLAFRCWGYGSKHDSHS